MRTLRSALSVGTGFLLRSHVRQLRSWRRLVCCNVSGVHCSLSRLFNPRFHHYHSSLNGGIDASAIPTCTRHLDTLVREIREGLATERRSKGLEGHFRVLIAFHPTIHVHEKIGFLFRDSKRTGSRGSPIDIEILFSRLQF